MRLEHARLNLGIRQITESRIECNEARSCRPHLRFPRRREFHVKSLLRHVARFNEQVVIVRYENVLRRERDEHMRRRSEPGK